MQRLRPCRNSLPARMCWHVSATVSEAAATGLLPHLKSLHPHKDVSFLGETVYGVEKVVKALLLQHDTPHSPRTRCSLSIAVLPLLTVAVLP